MKKTYLPPRKEYIENKLKFCWEISDPFRRKRVHVFLYAANFKKALFFVKSSLSEKLNFWMKNQDLI
jgi:hypothetical protein